MVKCAGARCEVQIAGAKCRKCDREIILSTEGKFCASCAIYVHLQCELWDRCGVCGRAFVGYERPKADPLGGALRPERSNKMVGPLLFGFLGVLFVLLWLYLAMIN